MKYGKTILTTIGVVALLVSFTSQASAAVIDDTDPADLFFLKIGEHGQGPQNVGHNKGLQRAGSRFRWGYFNRSPHFQIDLELDVDPDPFISAVLHITNLTGAPKEFSINPSILISPQISGGSLTSGSVSLTLIDLNQNGATLSTNGGGDPIYQSQIDGAPFKSLMDAPKTYYIPGGTLGFGPEDFGTPGVSPSHPGPEVLTSIGIELKATLSPGDMATIVATFEVTPEPATVALLTIGGLTVLLRRRRRA